MARWTPEGSGWVAARELARLGYLMLRRVGFRTRLERPADVLALVFLGALAGTLVSASIGTAALALAGAVPPAEYWSTWSVWWACDGMGCAVSVCWPAPASGSVPPL